MKPSSLLLFLVFTLSLALCEGRTLTVGEKGEYKLLKPAIAAAQPGDEILVRGGYYAEGNIMIDKPLHLKGIGWPIVDGKNEGEIFTITADHVTLEGFQVQNVGTSYIEDRAGIRVKKARHFTIHNNRLLNTFFGIYLERARYGQISGNVLIGEAREEMSSGNAIHLWYCKQVVVEENEVRGHRDGIYFEFVDSSLVHCNVSEDNLRYGLHFMFSNHDDYFQNTFSRNGAGVAVMFSRHIDMWENVFSGNWGPSSFGLLLKEIYDAEIRENFFRENTIGIYIEGSTRISYRQNEFRSNGWAIKMSGGCLSNHIEGNNFIANTFDLTLNSSVNDNSFEGNYWSAYSGYDLDRDGIGDVPYHPVKLFDFVVEKTPESVVLLRSFFVDLINYAERVSPVFTPAQVVDSHPRMKRIPPPLFLSHLE